MVTVTDGFVHPVSHLVFKWGHTEPRSEENPLSVDGAWGAGAHAGDRGRALPSELRRRGAEPVVPRAQAAPPVGSLLGRIGSADCHRGAAVSTRLRRGGLAQPSLDLSLRGLGPLSSRCGVSPRSSLPPQQSPSQQLLPPFLFSELSSPLRVRGALSEGPVAHHSLPPSAPLSPRSWPGAGSTRCGSPCRAWPQRLACPGPHWAALGRILA